MSSGRRFGRLFMPDARDAEFRIRRGKKTAAERTSRYWNANGWWGNQGETPRCVAYAWCLAPHHRALTADLRWVALGDLRPGDKLVAFDEGPHPENFGRYFVPATVEGVRVVPSRVLDVELATGQIITATPDHLWLVKRHWQWRATTRLRVRRGNRPPTAIPKLCDTWTPAVDYESGWLAGFLDGEGSVGEYAHVNFGQNPGGVLEKAVRLFRQRGCEVQVSTNGRHTGFRAGDPIHRRVHVNGGRARSMRLLGEIRPVRLLQNLDVDKLGRLEQRDDLADEIVAIRDGGIREIAQVQTDSGTLIVEGYPMHNCHWLEDAPVTHAGKAPIVDPAALYREAQGLDEWEGEDYDGTSVRAGAKALQKRGWVAEYRWAKNWSDIEYALMNLGPLVVGTLWTLGMCEPDGNGRIRTEGPEVGGHAYVLNGLNLKSGLLRIKNSWGPEYGRGGHAYIGITEWRDLWADGGEACLAVENQDPAVARIPFRRGA